MTGSMRRRSVDRVASTAALVIVASICGSAAAQVELRPPREALRSSAPMQGRPPGVAMRPTAPQRPAAGVPVAPLQLPPTRPDALDAPQPLDMTPGSAADALLQRRTIARLEARVAELEAAVERHRSSIYLIAQHVGLAPPDEMSIPERLTVPVPGD